MSLINKMLKDLESRQGKTLPDPGGRPIFQDLLSVNHERRRRGLVIGALSVTGLVAVGLFAAMQWSNRSMPEKFVTATGSAAVPVSPVVAESTTVAPDSTPQAPTAVPASTAPVVAPKPPVSTKPVATHAPAAKKPDVLARNTGTDSTAVAHIEKTERPQSAEELAENAYREAARLRVQGNPAEAERRLKSLLAGNPKLVKARELLVSIQLDSGRWVEAQDTLEQGVAQVPENLNFRFQLARLYLEHDADAQALSVLERARRDGQTDPELFAFLAALYQRTGRYPDAVKNYQDALAVRPVEGKWWLGLGISLEGARNNKDASAAYRRALESGRLPANLARYAEDRLRALAAQ